MAKKRTGYGDSLRARIRSEPWGRPGKEERIPLSEQNEVQGLVSGLATAGIEVYRVRGGSIEVAERIRYHLMDSGIRVLVGNPIEVRFKGRSPRSENPGLDDHSLFELVRGALSDAALARGFQETEASRQKVTDPVDPGQVLDVWFEVTYARTVSGVDEAADLVRWVLSVERFIRGSEPPEGGS